MSHSPSITTVSNRTCAVGFPCQNAVSRRHVRATSPSLLASPSSPCVWASIETVARPPDSMTRRVYQGNGGAASVCCST